MAKELYRAGNVILCLVGTEWTVVVQGVTSADSKTPGETYPKEAYYYQTLEQAAMRFCECVAGDGAESLAGYVEAFKLAAKRLHVALQEHKEVSA